jgi:glutamate synthase domain-containing protein 3
MEMVELEPFEDPGDLDYVQTMLMKHVALTGSTYVEGLLGDWETLQRRIVKVMPREYKRALADQAMQPAGTAEAPPLLIQVDARSDAAGSTHG